MTHDPKLERYLTSLEQVLKPFPISDRAEIVTEIKSHVLSALEKDPDAKIDSVLRALGEPETVANRYLIERGLKPTKPPISPIVKWVVIGFMGTVAMILLFAGLVITRFTPLIHVDDAKDHVSILGGMIEVDGKKGSISMNGESFGDLGTSSPINGSTEIAPGQSIAVKFGNGKFNFTSSADSKFSWSCRGPGHVTEPFKPVTENNIVSLNFDGFAGVKCDLTLPENAQISVHGMNGKINIEKAKFSVNAEMTNGKVNIEPDSKQSYRYDLSVVNGSADSFTSSDQPNAHTIAIHLVNGKINHAD